MLSLLTARLPNAAHAALWTSGSELCNSINIGSKTSLSTGLTSFSVISANAKAALLCKSMLSEYTSVLNAFNGPWLKKSTSCL